MKEKELNELLDKVIGTKGNLRIPAYWMRKVFSGLMEWAKGLTPDVDVPKKVSELENDADYATLSEVNTMGSNCNSYTETYVNNNRVYVDSALSSSSTNPVQNKVVNTAINKKQDKLTSGTNIKTLNGKSILGSGDITIDTSSFATKEELNTSVSNITKDLNNYATNESLLDNEEVVSLALLDLNERINAIVARIEALENVNAN